MASETDSTAAKSGSSTRTTKKSGSASKASASKQDGAQERPSRARAPRTEAKRAARPGQVAAMAARDLLDLTGKEAEGVTGLSRTDDGWTVEVEVLEVRRIPNTTDVLALYEVTTDTQGGLVGYRRLRRYARGVPRDD